MWEAFSAASVGLVLVFSWFIPILRFRSFQTGTRLRPFLLLVPVICFGQLAFVLRGYASPDVREDSAFLYMYFVAGILPFLAAVFVSGMLGISFLDDALQKGEPGAAFAITGAALASMSCYSGSNIGSGPGPEVVIFCSVLSLGALIILWALFEMASRPSLSEKITVERDTLAGLRLCSWLLALGIVLGWSVAGDWHSTRQTVSDFVSSAWPAVALLIMGIFFENFLSRRRVGARSAMPISLAAGALYLLLGSAWVIVNR